MNVNFKPGFTIINFEYDNPSSGGQSTVTPGNPEHSYLDPETGLIYVYMEDGMEGEGWYSTPDMEYHGKDLNVSGFIEQ